MDILWINSLDLVKPIGAFMGNNKETSPAVAKEASSELKNKNSSTGEKKVAGSALSQAEGNKKS